MILIFRDDGDAVRYAALTDDADIIYSESVPYPAGATSVRAIRDVFQTTILPKVRSHGKVFSHVGVVVPYVEGETITPVGMTAKTVRTIVGSEGLFADQLAATEAICLEVIRQWPHLTHVAVFDTCLSGALARHIAVPPFSYEFSKHHRVSPRLLQSYAHRGALLGEPKGDWISLYLGPVSSVAAFHGNGIVDALPAYSPIGALLGWRSSGSLDPGLVLRLLAKDKPAAIRELLSRGSGVRAIADIHKPFERLVNIAGLDGARKKSEEYSIETVEWVELALRSYIRDVRHAIGGMLTSVHGPVTLYLSGPYGRKDSPLVDRILEFPLDSLKVKEPKYTDLQAACLDIVSQPKR